MKIWLKKIIRTWSSAACLFVLFAAESAPAGSFTNTGAMNIPRNFHMATLLPNGKVLVAGGGSNLVNGLVSAELYDPDIGTWTLTGSMTASNHTTATLLPNGKVLVTGSNGTALTNNAELYDPIAEIWTATGVMSLNRVGHTATLLSSGKVLVAGGAGPVVTNTAELYDPTAGTWTLTGSMTTNRADHTATLLPNGKVLVVGGDGPVNNGLRNAELYDPATGLWTATGLMNTNHLNHTATLLPDGRVLVAGVANTGITNSAELYDPTSGTWTVTGGMKTTRRLHTATLLPSGRVLVVGGNNSSFGDTYDAEFYDPSTASWILAGGMNVHRVFHAATLLSNGKVLVTGGIGGPIPHEGGALASAELFTSPTLTINLQITNVAHHFSPADPIFFMPGIVQDEMLFAVPTLTNVDLSLYDNFELRLSAPPGQEVVVNSNTNYASSWNVYCFAGADTSFGGSIALLNFENLSGILPTRTYNFFALGAGGNVLNFQADESYTNAIRFTAMKYVFSPTNHPANTPKTFQINSGSNVPISFYYQTDQTNDPGAFVALATFTQPKLAMTYMTNFAGLSWPGRLNVRYQPQWSTNLGLGSNGWNNLGYEIKGNGFSNLVPDPSATNPAKFYRLTIPPSNP